MSEISDLHKWIITNNLDIVESSFQFDDDHHFDTIRMNCDLGEEKDDLKGNINSLVICKVIYKDSNKKTILISFGLNKYISVNDIIRKPS